MQPNPSTCIQAAAGCASELVVGQASGVPGAERSAVRKRPKQPQVKVPRARKIKAGILVTGVLLGGAAYVLLMTPPSQVQSLSLAFEKYGTTMDFGFNVQNVAFLWFTNSSGKSYCLPMMGSTNTFQRDTPLAQDGRGSYLIRWGFGDPAKPAPRVPFANFGRCLVVAPHSAVRLRVPLPPQGQKERVAVLCAEQPSGGPKPFWTKSIGLSVLRILPRSVGKKLLFSEPAVLRVWCGRDLSDPGEMKP